MMFLDLFLDFLTKASLSEIILLIFAINVVEIGFVVVVGNWMRRQFRHRPISQNTSKTTQKEYFIVFITLIINTLITIVGYQLWQSHWIVLTHGNWISMFFDTIIFILIIDLSMYLLHRVAHWPVLFPWLHGTHHQHTNPSPITLFILHPFETLSFGALWLAILAVYPASWTGVTLFLTFNLLFGMIGHLGVEPLGKSKFQKYFVKVFTTSTFHAIHHKTDQYNYGFYLVFWDKLLNTLDPKYGGAFIKK